MSNKENSISSFVFCYHRVMPYKEVINQSVHRTLFITPETFESHIKLMLSMGKIVNRWQLFDKTKYPKFMITFDDGWKDNYTNAFNILRKYKVPATIFISTKHICEQKLFWTEEINQIINGCNKNSSEIKIILDGLMESVIKNVSRKDLNSINKNWNADKESIIDRFVELLKVVNETKRGFFIKQFYELFGVDPKATTNLLLSWKEINEMSENDICIQSHTHSHQILDRIDRKRIDEEILNSRMIIEEKLGKTVDSISYPNGCHNRKYIQSSLRNHGYKYAFTLERSAVRNQCDTLKIPRFLMYEGIASDLSAYCIKSRLKRNLIIGINKVKRNIKSVMSG